MKKVLIVPDKFKGSLSAKEVCKAIERGLKSRNQSLEISFHPMADGGDGSLTVLKDHLSLDRKIVKTQDPIGRPIEASYFTSDKAAFIEIATASGIVLLNSEEKNPLVTSTLGTGLIIRDAIAKGYQNIYLFLGGSATNDGGMGIAQALGFQFLDHQKQPLRPCGESLLKVASIVCEDTFDHSQLTFTLFYDVANPLYGKKGAAHVYAPQKGADANQVEILDQGLMHFSKVLKKHTNIDVSQIPGSGAAGGIGASMIALCGAKAVKGFEKIATLTGLEEKIKVTDWVISGEGKLDHQSLQGKVIDGIAHLCKKHGKPLTLLVGKNELNEQEKLALGIDTIADILSIAKDIDDAMTNGILHLEHLAQKLEFKSS